MFTLRLLGGASLDGPDGPVAYLWPESGSDDARHLLRESLYILRSALGDDTVLSTGDDLRLNPARLTCDLWEFEAALARDDLEAAVGVYHGPFLSGFHLTGAEEFDPWAEGERSRLARQYGQALERLAEREMQGGDRLRAVEWWSRVAREDPYNSRIALRYMRALEAAGDRAGALRHASAHPEPRAGESEPPIPNPPRVGEHHRRSVPSSSTWHRSGSNSGWSSRRNELMPRALLFAWY